MPISCSVRVTRTAISPRLATRTLRKRLGIFEAESDTAAGPQRKSRTAPQFGVQQNVIVPPAPVIAIPQRSVLVSGEAPPVHE